jgi:hypothetical protein
MLYLLIYRKPKVRKVDSNVFMISLQENINKPEFSRNNFFWESKVKKLTIYENGKYDVQESSGKY